MIVDIQRAFTPDEMRDQECGLCRRDFRVESVIVTAMNDGRFEVGRVCPECIEYFGRANPEVFPSIEVYRALVERYPDPIWASDEEAGFMDDEDFDYEATFVWRASA